ncbi:hypothetical protein Pd630_LPD09113 (plasmid) [Rhodococcus opacus PD630]|nr:hypothetical protein Pd630_LPD09113 [Rhodococcus opacus PD630]
MMRISGTNLGGGAVHDQAARVGVTGLVRSAAACDPRCAFDHVLSSHGDHAKRISTPIRATEINEAATHTVHARTAPRDHRFSATSSTSSTTKCNGGVVSGEAGVDHSRTGTREWRETASAMTAAPNEATTTISEATRDGTNQDVFMPGTPSLPCTRRVPSDRARQTASAADIAESANSLRPYASEDAAVPPSRSETQRPSRTWRGSAKCNRALTCPVGRYCARRERTGAGSPHQCCAAVATG